MKKRYSEWSAVSHTQYELDSIRTFNGLLIVLCTANAQGNLTDIQYKVVANRIFMTVSSSATANWYFAVILCLFDLLFYQYWSLQLIDLQRSSSTLLLWTLYRLQLLLWRHNYAKRYDTDGMERCYNLNSKYILKSPVYFLYGHT